MLDLFRDFLSSGFQPIYLALLIFQVVSVLLAICVHEMAHGFAAYKLGDPTAKYDGRLSLNPLHHIDPLGALCMLLVGFGWAKPVSVNPNYFKNYKRDMALTALAGPLSNFMLAFIGMILGVHVSPLIGSGYFALFLNVFILINVGLGVFNLIPIPPLDGSKIFLSLLPERIYNDIMRYERYGTIILLVALYTNVLSPILSTCREGVINLLFFLAGGGF